MLAGVRSVAVVGVSANPTRPSHEVAEYLIAETGWRVHLVNPTLDRLFGQQVYGSLADIPEVPDLVDVFRRVEYLAGIVDEAVAVGAGIVWFQLGLIDDTSAERGRAAGLTVVQDRCLRVEHGRWRDAIEP